jgi:cytochrome b subunit of formate dehydrogenase
LLRSAWQDSGKYFSSQKSAFLVFAVLGLIILITGLIKMAGYYIGIPISLNNAATQAHDFFGGLFVVMFLVHVVMTVAVRSHRRLLTSFFTGKVKSEK